nr:hypothetical protein [Tanacetum cinerariifolium]
MNSVGNCSLAGKVYTGVFIKSSGSKFPIRSCSNPLLFKTNDEIKEYREKKMNNPWRDRPISNSLELFEYMNDCTWLKDAEASKRPRNRRREDEDEESEENPFGDGSSSDEQSVLRPRRNQKEDNRRWESGMRVNIPDCDVDTLNPEGFIDWLDAVEEVFEFKERALAFEKQNRRVGSSSFPAITGVSGSGNGVSHFAPNQAKAGGGNTKPVPKATGSSGLKCFNCDNDDDVAYGDYETASVYDDEPEFEEEYVSRDVGVNLVVRRSCLTPKADGNDWLKYNIFQSTCTILGKVCTFVCDSGSCDSLMAEEAVQKLGLKTENCPKPYKLQWHKKGGEVTVSKRVHIPFFVGTTYKDNVWGVNITLMPNKPKEVVNKPTGTLLTLSQFEDELEIVEKINSNAYRLKLPSHIRCSDAFNVKHLLPYHGNYSDEDSVGSRMNFVYPGGNDVNLSIEERDDLFLEAQDRVRKRVFSSNRVAVSFLLEVAAIHYFL